MEIENLVKKINKKLYSTDRILQELNEKKDDKPLKKKYNKKIKKLRNLKKDFKNLKKNYENELDELNKKLSNYKNEIGTLKNIKKSMGTNKKAKKIINEKLKEKKEIKKQNVERKKQLNLFKKIKINKELYSVYKVEIIIYVDESKLNERNRADKTRFKNFVLRNDIKVGEFYDEPEFQKFLSYEEKKNIEYNYNEDQFILKEYMDKQVVEFYIVEKIDLNKNDNKFIRKFDLNVIKKEYLFDRFTDYQFNKDIFSASESDFENFKKTNDGKLIYKQFLKDFNTNKNNVIYRWKINNLVIESKQANTINNMFVVNSLRFNDMLNKYEIKTTLKNIDEIDNKIANACFYDVLIETYKSQIENSIKENGVKRYSFIVNYENLFKLFHPEINFNNVDDIKKIMYNNMGMTFPKSTLFFDKFGLDLMVYDINNNEIFKYISSKNNTVIHPQTLNLIYHNNHVYRITENKKLGQLKDNNFDDEALKVSDSYFTKYNVEKDVIILNEDSISNDINKLFNIMENSNDEIENFVFITNKNLIDYVNILNIELGHIVNVSFDVDEITSINAKFEFKTKEKLSETVSKIKIQKVVKNFVVKKPFNDVNHDATDFKITTKEYYDAFYEQEKNLFSYLICDKFKSTYHKKTIDFFNNYYPNITIGRTNNNIEDLDNYIEFDFCKAYTYCLMNMEYIPVYTLLNVQKNMIIMTLLIWICIWLKCLNMMKFIKIILL